MWILYCLSSETAHLNSRSKQQSATKCQENETKKQNHTQLELSSPLFEENKEKYSCIIRQMNFLGKRWSIISMLRALKTDQTELKV